jgi:hypothetical protein
MFLYENYTEFKKNEVRAFRKDLGTFTVAFQYWKENLFERVMRLFVWSNTDPIPAKEIEMRLILQGHCGISNVALDGKPAELTAFFGNFYGVGKYFDEKPFYMLRCPIWSGEGKVGEDTVVIDNNALRNPVLPLIDRYAVMLAHAETTIIDSLVNARDAGGVPVAANEIQKQSIESYYQKLYNGEVGLVRDPAAVGVQYAGADRHTQEKVLDLIETRQKLLKSFYSDIGVRASFEKRSNAVVEEVEADTSMLLLNISDMLDSRKRGAEKVNKLFGTNFSVELAKEIQYTTEGPVNESED